MKTKNIFRMLLVAVTLLLGANNVKAQDYSITYQISGNGTVTADKETANEGDNVTLTVTPGVGQQLKSLIIRDQNYNELFRDVTQFTMPAKNVVIYAEFEAIRYNITINSTEHGGLYVDDRSNVTYGATIRIRVQADYGYELESISVVAGNNPIEVSSSYTFTMPASDVTISGTFKPIAPVAAKHKLTYNTIKDNVTTLYKQYEIEEGAAITPEPDPNPIEGYTFGGWSNIPATMPNYDVTVTGTYTVNTYTITIGTIENGSVNVAQSANYGSEVTVYPSPNNGYQLDHVNVVDENGNSITVSDNKFIMPASNVTVTATFTPREYKVTYYLNNVYYSEEMVAYGSPITPPEPVLDFDFEFNGWKCNNGDVPATMPANDLRIDGAYSRLYKITFVCDDTQGSVSADKEKYKQYDNASVTVTPKEGFEINTVVATNDADNSTIQFYNTNPYTFQVGTSDITFTVTFKASGTVTYPVNITATNGTVTATPNNAAAGTTITLTLAPNTGYELESLTVTDADGTAITVTNNTFTMPESAVNVVATFKQISEEKATITLSDVSLVFGNNFAVNASPESAASLAYTFTNSSNENVARIVNGQVIPVGAGSTTISASFTGNDDFEAYEGTFELTVTAPAAPEGAISLGAVWLGDYASPIAEGSETKNGSQPTVESTVFTGIKKDDTIRIYGKIGPLDATNWDIQIWDKNRGANLISNTQTTCTTLAASGYADFVVPSDDVAEKLSTIGAVLNGRNVTVTAIQVIEGETPQPTYYTVTLDPDIVGGTVGMDSSNRQFEAGTVVEFWAEPAEGYELDYVSVTFVNARESKTEGNKTYFTFTMPSDDVTVTAIFNAVYVPPVIAERAVYIGSTGYATWTPDIAIDYGVVVQSGVKAYRADSKTTADGEAAILLKEITTKVPAHTPVLLIADATGTYTFSEGEGEATSVGNNLLRQGSDSYTAANDNYYVLTVSTTTGRVVFAQLKQSARIGSDKAYLDLTGVSGARRHTLSIRFDDDGDDTTGINALERDTDLGNAAVYNLNGQRVEKPSKGLYIVNGKKVLIK